MNGIQKIQHHFAQGQALIAYLTAGDGGIKQTLAAACALIDGGINMLEIGIPFSDPIADGVVIQRAAARALRMGTTLRDVLTLIEEIRKKSNIPLILFSYCNPIFSTLHTNFIHDAKVAGINGILLVDCPIEESQDFQHTCLIEEVAPIYVIAPTTEPSRIRHLDNHGKGFLYYACRQGTTGIKTALPHDFSEKIQLIKANTHLPVVVGFGIATRDTAKEVLQQADGVVIGSLFVKALEKGMQPAELTHLAMQINPFN